MPEDRLLHPRLRNSVKVSALPYLARCVWVDLLLGADDYGVIPNRPAKVRADNLAFLARETETTISEAIEAVVATGLFLPFEHQGQTYLTDPRWQDFQKIERPRRTFHPIPERSTLLLCTPATIVLFASYHPAAASFPFPECFRNARRTLSKNVGEGSRKRIRLTANGKRLTAEERGSGGKPEPSGFDRFWSTYPKRVGKDDAARAWDKRGCEPLADVIVAAVERQQAWLMRADERGGKKPGDLCPNPATWLNQGRWKDEPPTVGVPAAPRHRPNHRPSCECPPCEAWRQANPTPGAEDA